MKKLQLAERHWAQVPSVLLGPLPYKNTALLLNPHAPARAKLMQHYARARERTKVFRGSLREHDKRARARGKPGRSSNKKKSGH